MKPISTPKQRSYAKQRGDFLLESLIGMVLLSVIGLGITFVTTKVNSSQVEMRYQEIIVNTLRAALIRNGINSYDTCSEDLDFTLPNGAEVAVTKSGCDGSSAQAAVNGVVVSDVPQPIFLKASYSKPNSTTAEEIVVGGTWLN